MQHRTLGSVGLLGLGWLGFQAIGNDEFPQMVFGQIVTRVSARLRQGTAEKVVLAPDAFERAAMCERMRVDRNGSILAMLLIEFGQGKPSSSLENLGRSISERLRMTDTIGRLRDGRMGILLPDTPLAGAWKVADDLSELISASEAPPRCEVLIYPDQRDSRWEQDEIDGEPRPLEVSAAVAGAAPGCEMASADAMFIRPMPAWKRGVDIFVGGLGLVIAAPVIAIAAVAVAATSPGGAFFLQPREGLGGRRFNIFKLRTMHTDAESRKSGLRRHSEQDGPAFKMTNDPRVTPVGRVLRALSLDELPQLLNVVRGEMSLVGPRPLPVEESQQCKPWQRQRLQVTPGITCIWQVHARNQVPFDDWVRMDLQYARRRSPWSDLRLLLETGPSVLISKGPR